MSKSGTSFGGYDAARNNCQHFCMWARHNKARLLVGDADMVSEAAYDAVCCIRSAYAEMLQLEALEVLLDGPRLPSIEVWLQRVSDLKLE